MWEPSALCPIKIIELYSVESYQLIKFKIFQQTFHNLTSSIPGIYRDKTMLNKLVYITNDDTLNFPTQST